MIKYTKEIKPYKSKLKEILLRLLKHRVTLAKYKSHIILAVLVGVSSYVLGHTIAYNNDITWVYRNRDTTVELISTFKKTYDKQAEIASNYHIAYTDLLNCLIGDPSCDVKTSSQKQLELSTKRNSLVDELNKLNFETDRIMTKFSLSNPSLQNQPSPSASNAVINQENTTSGLNVPDSWKDTSNNIEGYYKVYKNPTVLYLRKAINAFLSNDSSDINISNVAVEKDSRDGIISGLDSFDKEYYRSKFVVLTINKSISGGVDIQILFQDKPDRIFYAWVYQLADGSFELRGFNSKEEMEPKAMKAIQTEYKTFLEDKEHAL